eukprot:936678-Amphidinium_carterae.1
MVDRRMTPIDLTEVVANTILQLCPAGHGVESLRLLVVMAQQGLADEVNRAIILNTNPEPLRTHEQL